MGLVSPAQSADGQTIEAADINNPINTIANEFNGNIDNDNIKAAAGIAGTKIADGAITNAKLATTSGEIGASWLTWSPTWTNFTLGNGTVDYAKYLKIGKTVWFKLKVTLGSTSAVSTNPTFTLPVTTSSDYALSKVEVFAGNVALRDTSASATRPAVPTWDTTTTCTPRYLSGTPANVAIDSVSPFTWATGDIIQVHASYEAA